MSAPPYIEFKNVTKKFGKKVIIDNLNLEIPFGEITGIIGASGSGKTTILNLLIGFVKPTSGIILFQSRDIFKDIKNVSNIFGVGAQSCSFYDYLTVKENLHYFGSLYGLKRKKVIEVAKELIRKMELEDATNTLAKDLSTGMQRRLDLACSLIHDPKVVILDEPTEDLDPILRKEIVALIKKIKAENKTVVITSHLLNEISDLCDSIAILNHGRIIVRDSPKRLLKKYNKRNLDEVFESIVKKDVKPEKEENPIWSNHEEIKISKKELEETLGKKK